MKEAPRKTGKWLCEDIPHSGWRCVEVREESTLCDMCEVTRIAYAHVMHHEHYPLPLSCGCVCAGFMTEDPATEQLREVLFKWRRSQDKTSVKAIRRKGWRGSKYRYADCDYEFVWRLPRRPASTFDRFEFTVRIKNNGGWRYCLSRNLRSELLCSDPFPTAEAAALAGIEHAELLMADPHWVAADCEAMAEARALWKAEQAARYQAMRDRRY